MSRTAAKILGDQLQRAREERGLSVAQAARILRVERQTLYNYENGRWLPKMGVLVAAATLWNVQFEIRGCKVVPEELKGKPARKPEPVQTAFSFPRSRSYKAKTVRIRQHDHELIITTVARISS